MINEVLKKAYSLFLHSLEQRGILPGEHVHDESNPFGMHTHTSEDSMEDSAHIHTPQNPMGEHAHGPNKGMRLADGAHKHDFGMLGEHFHADDIPKDITPISNPFNNTSL